MRKTRILSLALALLFVLAAMTACSGDSGTTSSTGSTSDTSDTSSQKEVVYQEIDEKDAVVHEDTTSVYDAIGPLVTIDMVKEDKETGLATVEVDGKTYELGMDFLSMAMVYNCTVPEGSDTYKTQDDVYNAWYKLYIMRWNYLVPEIPLYANIYYDVYNAKIQNFVTTPYWGPADAIISASVKEGADNSVILGSTTELSGAFRNSAWGKSSPAASDLDIENLISGHSTIMTDKSGTYGWNTVAVDGVPTSVVNEDGTLTYTIKIKEDLVFSDGSKITAKNYIASVLANSTAVSVAAGGTGTSGVTLIGYRAFAAYDGTNGDAEGVSKTFAGVKLIDDYTFSVTYTADYAGYYYSIVNAGFSPVPLEMYLGKGNDIVVAEDGTCGLSDGFYAKETKDGAETYKVASEIVANLKWNSKLPFSGPYVIKNFDESAKIATLELNPNYPGDDQRGVASVKTITYVQIVSETQLDQFKNGEVDVLAGITGGEDTEAALKVVKDNPEKYAETHYDRPGYGKIGFRADYGPTAFASVRRAIMHTINRNEFAQTFTGGHGSVVHGPYYTGFSAFAANKKYFDEMLNTYEYSVDEAIAALEEGGWTYNVRGEAFDPEKDDIRYKKLEGYELTADNIKFESIDKKYKTVKIDGAYYLPLAINWFGTQPNSVTDQLLTAWQTNKASTTDIGMYITYTSSTFEQAVMGEYNHDENFGYDGVPKLNAVNFATGFNSALYDYAFNWSINPDYADYSVCFVFDEADYLENYNK